MSDEFHWLPLAVDERVWAAQLLDGNHPRKPFGAWSLLCAKDGKNCCGSVGPTAWSKQSEVPHRMTIAFGDVHSPWRSAGFPQRLCSILSPMLALPLLIRDKNRMR
jgi:hypothetical protein